MPIEFDADGLSVKQLMVLEEYSERQKAGTVKMTDVRDLFAILLKQTPAWVEENVTAGEMKRIMVSASQATARVNQEAVPLVTSGDSSPTPTATDTALPAGS